MCVSDAQKNVGPNMSQQSLPFGEKFLILPPSDFYNHAIDTRPTGFPSDMTTSRGLWPAHGLKQEGVQQLLRRIQVE
jgi:hypothetical protein